MRIAQPSSVITVEHLTIEAFASDEDPYGRGGFSAVVATLATKDSGIVAVLKASYVERRAVVISCGGLRLTGVVTKFSRRLTGGKAVIAVDSLRSAAPA